VPDACVTDPLVWAKGDKGRDTFTIPKGRKQQVVSTLRQNDPDANFCQLPGRDGSCPLPVDTVEKYRCVAGFFLSGAFFGLFQAGRRSLIGKQRDNWQASYAIAAAAPVCAEN
jgi:hypothetical protein